MPSAQGAKPTIDVSAAIDQSPWTTFQITIVAFAALTIILDGFDSQLIGNAIPTLIKEWNLKREDFQPVVAAGLFGMAFGSTIAGWAGDRFGRRVAILSSVLIFGVATSAIGLANDLMTVGILRFIAGAGIGGALPAATTYAAEFTPARRRTLAVTATIVCVPLGGTLAAFFAAQVLPDWRLFFMAGGAPAIVFFALLYWLIPETPRFLATRPARAEELRGLLGRMSYQAPADAQYIDSAAALVEKREGFRALFEHGRSRDTIAIWVAMFFNLFAVYAVFSWLPTMLSAEGLNVGLASGGLKAYNFGGIFGALVCALIIGRFGSRWPLIICGLASAASALGLRFVDIHDDTILTAGLGLHGLFVNAMQCSLYAICAHVYPTTVRTTGTAYGLTIGRLGAIISAYAGATAITMGGASGYLAMLAIAMLGTTAGIVMLRNHIPPLARAA